MTLIERWHFRRRLRFRRLQREYERLYVDRRTRKAEARAKRMGTPPPPPRMLPPGFEIDPSARWYAKEIRKMGGDPSALGR